jgi:hypothetical protein
MQPIKRRVEDLIQYIVAGSDDAGRQGANDQPPGKRAVQRYIAYAQRNYDSRQDEDVLCPMVNPEYCNVRSNPGGEIDLGGHGLIRS